jgi:hypothetical protein
MRDATMKKLPSKGRTHEMRAEYDFSGGVRGVSGFEVGE